MNLEFHYVNPGIQLSGSTTPSLYTSLLEWSSIQLLYVNAWKLTKSHNLLILDLSFSVGLDPACPSWLILPVEMTLVSLHSPALDSMLLSEVAGVFPLPILFMSYVCDVIPFRKKMCLLYV
jgi:zinc transporter ZupT